MKIRIHQGDMVQVIAGSSRGHIGKVLEVLRDEQRVIVEGANKVLKHVRPSQRNPRGGRLSKEMPIHISNVLLVNPELSRGVRIGVRVNEAGDKVRVCRVTGKELGIIRPRREKDQANSN